jgi:uncharacterized membrane protein
MPVNQMLPLELLQMPQSLPLIRILLVLLVSVATEPSNSWGQSDENDSTSTAVIQFQRDIAPLLVSRCIKCHGEEDAKNDFRVDDKDSLLGYVEPGDIESSSLWTDYLRTDDADLLMPPAEHGGPLSPAELAMISVWIHEGANWPDDAAVGGGVEKSSEADVVKAPMSLPARVWAFQGYLHPATVHFPIALLLLGGMFVVVGIKYPVLGENVALVCLFFGTLSAIAATVMGWSFATQQGYGSWDRFDMDSEIFWHRWSAVIVTVAAIITSLFALSWLRNQQNHLKTFWKIGLLVIAMMVGAVGHQGGELTYGKTFYQEAFNILLGVPNSVDAATADIP